MLKMLQIEEEWCSNHTTPLQFADYLKKLFTIIFGSKCHIPYTYCTIFTIINET